MANAEYNRLEKDGQGAAANDGLKLLLQDSREKRVPRKIRPKRREGSTRGSPEALGEKPLRGIRSAAEGNRGTVPGSKPHVD